MTANLFGDRFFGRRQPAWHGLGKTFDGPMTATQAAEDCGLMYEVLKTPLFFEDITGAMVEIPDKKVLVRQPTNDDPTTKVFGIVSPDFEYLSMSDVCTLLDPIAEKWPIETAGALGDGETVFLTFQTGEMTIAGEQWKGYFVYLDTLDGKHASKVLFTPVRIVCQNTVIMGQAAAVVTVNLPHTSSYSNVMTWQMQMVKDMTEAMETSKVALEAFAAASLTMEQVQAVLEATYPTPKRPAKSAFLEFVPEDPANDASAMASLYNEGTRATEVWDYYAQRAVSYRNGALELYNKFNAEFPELANTKYALLNAITESADYREGRDDDAVSTSSLIGTRSVEKRRAWKALENIA